MDISTTTALFLVPTFTILDNLGDILILAKNLYDHVTIVSPPIQMQQPHKTSLPPL